MFILRLTQGMFPNSSYYDGNTHDIKLPNNCYQPLLIILSRDLVGNCLFRVCGSMSVYYLNQPKPIGPLGYYELITDKYLLVDNVASVWLRNRNNRNCIIL